MIIQLIGIVGLILLSLFFIFMYQREKGRSAAWQRMAHEFSRISTQRNKEAVSLFGENMLVWGFIREFAARQSLR